MESVHSTEDTSTRPPSEVVVTTADSQSEPNHFLSQCFNTNDASVMDQLKQLLETKLANGGNVQEVVDMITKRAVQQVFAQSAVKQLLKKDPSFARG